MIEVQRCVVARNRALKLLSSAREELEICEAMLESAEKEHAQYEKKVAFITVYKATYGVELTEGEAVYLLGIER